MKYIFIVPDGAADYPIEMLAGKTPLEAADKPFMDSLAKKGILGRVKTVPSGFTPASDVANLSLLGYEPEKYYCGRGPLEAANLGVTLEGGDVAFRCNLITEAEGKILDYSAGHISDHEAKLLIEHINTNVGTKEIEFYPGKSYRHLMVFRQGAGLGLEKLTCVAPHDIMGKPIKKHMPQGKNNEVIAKLMQRSQELLKEHEINKVRIDLGENPANMIWLWGSGKKPAIPLFQEKFGLRGAVISAVDLINGIGKIIGLKVIKVEGANAYYDTNYQGKALAALEALEEVDFVFIHIEATDEAGHNQDLRMKIACIERIDKLVVGTIIQKMQEGTYRILIAPDHPTPVSKRTHTDEPVPFLMAGSGISSGGFSAYSETDAANSKLYLNSGIELMKYFLNPSR
ncbi:MAG: cofactor-independent phosphoglycerate mutase [Candidatus Omnitrophota bacterium]